MNAARARFARLAALAAEFLARLGRPLVTLADAGPLAPVIVPLLARGTAWLPLRPLGLPGDYTPMTGGEP